MMKTIPTKESLTIEFKSDRKKYPDADLVDEIVGMANTEGGTLYLGVEDDGTPSGLHKDHQNAIQASALIANKTVPSISVRAEIFMADNAPVMAIDIPKSRAVVATSEGKILRRKLKADGSPENVPMFPYEITSRLSDLSLLDFSSQPLTTATIEDLDPNQIVRLRKIISKNPDSDQQLLSLSDLEIEQALHFVVSDHGNYIPTITGMLMIGREDRIQTLMPTARADFQVLEGSEVRINDSFTKPILELAELFENYLKPWNPEQEMEYGLFRIPVPVFSRRAFREGLMNAFAHRDYSMMGRIRIAIDDEGLTISSPGGFIEGVNINNLISVEPHGRNQSLSDAMKRVGLAEKTGRGIDRIYEGSIAFGRPWPDYSASTSTRVNLFIARAQADLPFAKMIADIQNTKGRPLSINYLMILSALKQERRMSQDRITNLTHINPTRAIVILKEMLEDGLIEEIGSSRNPSYMLSSHMYRQEGKEKEYVRQSGIDKIRYPEMILKLAREQNGIISKRDVADLLHVEDHVAYSYINRLVSEGRLVKNHNGKYANYRLTN